MGSRWTINDGEGREGHLVYVRQRGESFTDSLSTFFVRKSAKKHLKSCSYQTALNTRLLILFLVPSSVYPFLQSILFRSLSHSLVGFIFIFSFSASQGIGGCRKVSL